MKSDSQKHALKQCNTSYERGVTARRIGLSLEEAKIKKVLCAPSPERAAELLGRWNAEIERGYTAHV